MIVCTNDFYIVADSNSQSIGILIAILVFCNMAIILFLLSLSTPLSFNKPPNDRARRHLSLYQSPGVILVLTGQHNKHKSSVAIVPHSHSTDIKQFNHLVGNQRQLMPFILSNLVGFIHMHIIVVISFIMATIRGKCLDTSTSEVCYLTQPINKPEIFIKKAFLF